MKPTFDYENAYSSIKRCVVRWVLAWTSPMSHCLRMRLKRANQRHRRTVPCRSSGMIDQIVPPAEEPQMSLHQTMMRPKLSN